MEKLQYNDFEEFIKINKLKKNVLADYLHVSAAFISQVCRGKSKLSPDKLNLILTNKEWKTDMLTANQPIEQKIINGHNNTHIANSNDRTVNANMLMKALDEIAEQRSVTQKSQEQIDRLISLLEKTACK